MKKSRLMVCGDAELLGPFIVLQKLFDCCGSISTFFLRPHSLRKSGGKINSTRWP